MDDYQGKYRNSYKIKSLLVFYIPKFQKRFRQKLPFLKQKCLYALFFRLKVEQVGSSLQVVHEDQIFHLALICEVYVTRNHKIVLIIHYQCYTHYFNFQELNSFNKYLLWCDVDGPVHNYPSYSFLTSWLCHRSFVSNVTTSFGQQFEQ